MPAELEITYVKSAIGYSERQKRTVQALGLRKLHDSVRQPDNPSIRGMIHSIQHLLSYREVEGDESATASQQGSVAATDAAGQKGDIT